LSTTGWWFSPGIPVSTTNKTDCHDITEILLKVNKHHNPSPNPWTEVVSYGVYCHFQLFFIYISTSSLNWEEKA